MIIKANHGTRSLPDQGLVPIRTVSNLTGVNSVTLRAWERRYDLVKPIRTPKGHRLYTMADVALINQVVSLLNNGMAIGQARQVLDAGKSRPEPSPGAEEERDFDPWRDYRHRLLQATIEFDGGALNDVYTEVLSLYPVDIATRRSIVPLLRELGERWARGEGSIAEEHFFSMFLRNKLGARFHHLGRNQLGPKLLAACLPGEYHEVGLLLFGLAALDWDYRVVLLGPNTPLSELPPVVERAAIEAVVLSGSAEAIPTTVEQELPRLCRSLAIPVFIGGQITNRYADAIADAGAIPLGDELTLALRRIDATLNHR